MKLKCITKFTLLHEFKHLCLPHKWTDSIVQFVGLLYKLITQILPVALSNLNPIIITRTIVGSLLQSTTPLNKLIRIQTHLLKHHPLLSAWLDGYMTGLWWHLTFCTFNGAVVPGFLVFVQ